MESVKELATTHCERIAVALTELSLRLYHEGSRFSFQTDQKVDEVAV